MALFLKLDNSCTYKVIEDLQQSVATLKSAGRKWTILPYFSMDVCKPEILPTFGLVLIEKIL